MELAIANEPPGAKVEPLSVLEIDAISWSAADLPTQWRFVGVCAG